MRSVIERTKGIELITQAKAMAETASVKNNPINKQKYLLKSINAITAFMEDKPYTKRWDQGAILINTARSILSGLEDGVEIPQEDIDSYQQLLDDFEEEYNDHLEIVSQESESSRQAKEDDLAKRRAINEQLRVTTPGLGLKALAIVSLDMLNTDNVELDDSYESPTDGRATANLQGDEYRKLSSQLSVMDAYLDKTKQLLPTSYSERFVVLRQPVLITGDVRYQPSAKAKRYIAREGIELDGYWVLKNQLVLGISKNVGKVVKNPEFRSSVEERLRDIYQADLEKKLSKARNESQRLRMTQEMEERLAEDLEDELQNLARPINTDILVKAIGKQLGFQVIMMDGSSQVKGSPFTYYWLVSADLNENVLHGLYSSISNWALPYK